MRPLSSDLCEFIHLLNTNSVKYVIVGAWALAFHGRPRYTGDLDIFVARDDENADKLMAVIEALGFGHAGIKREDFLQVDHVIQLGREPNRIDILTGISGVSFDEAWANREPGKIADTAVFIISRDLLIKFDVGVVSALQGREFRPGTPEFGEAFETYLMHELMSYRDYVSGDALSHWRSASGFEVDFIIADHTAVEVKAKENVSAQDVKSLYALAEEKKLKRYLCVSLEPRRRKMDAVSVLPWEEFLDELWSGEYA